MGLSATAELLVFLVVYVIVFLTLNISLHCSPDNVSRQWMDT